MDVLRQGFSVVLVFSLLGAVLWALRRGGRVSFQGFAKKRILGHTQSMGVVERLVLTPQHTLHVLRVNGREVILATHPQGCTLIAEPAAAARAMGAQA